jgi:CheY-like chemotaxis protein
MEAKEILLVEDDPRDVELTLVALEEHNLANKVVVARDGAEALDYLYRRGAYGDRPVGHPLVILLDLKMPKVDGLEVLRQVKGDPVLKTIPVVVLTSSRQDRDIVESYSLGVNAYVVKPVAFDRFVEMIRQLGLFWIVTNEPPPGAVNRRR